MADETRERILHAAGPIFAEKGFEAATVRGICAAASVNIASVNYHFGDKAALYLETMRLAHTLRLQQVPPATWPEKASPQQKLNSFIHNLLARMTGDREYSWQTRLMMREMLQPSIACKPLAEDFIRPQHDRLLAILDELLPAAVPDHRREQIAFSVVGQCMLYRVAREFVALLVPDEMRAEHFGAEQLAEHVTSFSLAALSELAKSATASDQPGPASATQSSEMEQRRWHTDHASV